MIKPKKTRASHKTAIETTIMQMKKNTNTKTGVVWMACLILGVAMAACSSDADEPENNDGRKLRQLTITDAKDNPS